MPAYGAVPTGEHVKSSRTQQYVDAFLYVQGAMTGGQLTDTLAELAAAKSKGDLEAVHARLDALRPTERQIGAIARGVFRACERLGLDENDL